MSYNVTADLVKGYRCEWKVTGYDLLINGYTIPDPWDYCQSKGLSLFTPGEFAHAKDDVVIGIGLGCVGDYEDRVVEFKPYGEHSEDHILNTFMEDWDLPEPGFFLVGNCQ